MEKDISKSFFVFLRDNLKDRQPQDVSGVYEQPFKPVFKKIPDDVEVREGNMVRFDTVVTGRPAPELAWYCNERMVHPDDHHKVRIKNIFHNSEFRFLFVCFCLSQTVIYF